MEELDLRKILIKFPRSLHEVFSCFPFLVTVSEEFPKAEINVIVEHNCSLAFSFLPFKVKVFERPAHQMSLIETHKYCANLNDVFNIDLFLDLESTLNSSFMGFNFRAKERVGYEVDWNKYLLTKRFPLPQTSIEKKSMNLLELYLNKDFRSVRVAKSFESGQPVDQVEQLFKEPEPPPFVMVMLDNFEHVSRQIEIWKRFLDGFQNQKFIIWTMQDEDVISDLFKSVDLGHNELFIHRGSNPKEILYLLSKVKGVIVNNLWAEGLCNYVGVEAISFLDQREHWPKYEYFKNRPLRVVFSPDKPIEYLSLGDIKEWTDMNQVIDQVHFNFKL